MDLIQELKNLEEEVVIKEMREETLPLVMWGQVVVRQKYDKVNVVFGNANYEKNHYWKKGGIL